MIKKVILTMILIFISNPIFPQEESIKKILSSIGEEFTQALLSEDYELIISHMTDDVIVFPIFGKPIKGKSAYRDAVKKLKASGAKYQSISGTSTEMWDCGEMIYDIGTFGMSLVTNESPKPIAFYGSYFHVWQKQSNGIYKLHYMMSNLDYNPYEK